MKMGNNLEIEYIKIDDLKLSEYNPRVIDENNLKNLKESLRIHGWLSPLVINSNPKRKNILISGHQRIKVAEELGMKEVPVIRKDLNLTQEKALNLALNKIGGEFEEDKLIELLSQINNENEDLLASTGFDTTEINYLLGIREQSKEDIFAKSNEDDFEQGNKYGIKIGDIVKLDEHCIICGDSSDPDNLKKLMGDKKIDLVITSPPYNLDIKYGKYRDNQDLKDYLSMIEEIFLNIKDFMENGRFLCINIGREWGPINMPSKYDNIMDSLGYIFFRNIYWSKPRGAARATTTTRNPFPRYYIPRVQTEIIQIYAIDEKPDIYDHMITYKIGEGPREKKDKIPKMLLEKYSGNVWEMMTETTLSGNHPAPFPVQLPFNCIRFFSFDKERILDPFLGAGSTMIAADQLNRICYGIELDPDYVSFAIERFLMYKPNAKLEITNKS